MARPERNNVDYFPFLCKEGDAMQYIEHKYGNDGYATWVKILRELAWKNYHYLDLSNNRRLMTLAGKCKVSEEKLIEIINDLSELGEFDKELWEVRILWNQKFIDSVQDAYKKRLNNCITREGVLRLISGLSPSDKPEKVVKKVENPIITHEFFPNQKLPNDALFESLINGNEINEISRITMIPLETLKLKIEPFRKAADLQYTSYGKFTTHFKNWVLKSKDIVSTTTTKPVKLT